MRQVFQALAFSMVLVGTTGCTNNVTIVEQGNNPDHRVVYVQRNFMTELDVEDIKSRKVGGILQVAATLRNRWNTDLQFSYQFRFFDDDGFPVGPEGRPWTPITLMGDDVQTVTAMAPNDSATSFQIVISNE